MLKLQELDYEIIYFPGSLNNTADFLSRYKEIEPRVETKINSLELEMNVDWVDEQIKDKELAIVKMSIKTGDDNLNDSINEEVWKNNKNFLKIKTDILMLTNKEGIDLIVVPNHLRNKICSLYHDSITGGHMGFERTYRAILARFYWPKMKAYIFDYCTACDVCQRFKVKNSKNVWPLVSIKVNKPWDLIGLDFAGPLKQTPRGNRHFILGIDYCSKLIMAKAVVDGTAETTISFVREDIINKHGTPVAILSDQGRNFEAKDFDAFCLKYGIKKIRTTSYHPQCNGLAERSIRTIKQMLAAFVNEKHDDWDLKLGEVVFAYNNTVQSSTGFAPNQVIYGKLLPNTSDRKLNVVQDTRINQEVVINEIGRRLEKVQEGQKKQYDKKICDKTTYKTGDFVVLVNSRKTVGQVRSFEPKYIGPFEVIRLIGDTNYELIDPKTGKTIVVHYNRMAKYTARDHNHSLKQLVDDDASSRPEFCILDEVIISSRDIAIMNRIQSRHKVNEVIEWDVNSPEREKELDKLLAELNQEEDSKKEEEENLISFKGDDNDDYDDAESNEENSENDEEEKPFKCEVCDFSSKSIKGLNIHKGKTHKNE